MQNKGSLEKITVEFLKKCYDNIVDLLLNIINTSHETDIFPDNLKISTIIPIPKVQKSNKGSVRKSVI